MRKFFSSVVLLGLGLATLSGCGSKGIETVDKDKVVPFDPKRDDNVREGGGPAKGSGPPGSGTMGGKKALPPPAK